MTGARVVEASASARSPSWAAHWGRPGAAGRRASRDVCRTSARVSSLPMQDGCRRLAPSCGQGDRWSGLSGRGRRVAHRRCAHQRLLPRDGSRRPLSLPCTRACGSRKAHSSRLALCACLISRLRPLGRRLFPLVPHTPLPLIAAVASATAATAALQVAVVSPPVVAHGWKKAYARKGTATASWWMKVIAPGCHVDDTVTKMAPPRMSSRSGPKGLAQQSMRKLPPKLCRGRH
jgi:hypothetical protein